MKRLLTTFLLCCVASVATADTIHRWVDKDGVVHYSNLGKGKGRSPARYEKTPGGGMRVVLEGRKEAAAAPKRTRSAPLRSSAAYEEHLREACARYQIPLSFARAIAAAESNFDPKAVSRAGAMGLMQLMPATAVAMYVEDAFDPRENIHGGVRYLRVLTNLFDGDLVKVIAAYNAGPGAVQRAGGVPNFAETKAYVERVLRFYEQYREEEARGGQAGGARAG